MYIRGAAPSGLFVAAAAGIGCTLGHPSDAVVVGGPPDSHSRRGTAAQPKVGGRRGRRHAPPRRGDGRSPQHGGGSATAEACGSTGGPAISPMKGGSAAPTHVPPPPPPRPQPCAASGSTARATARPPPPLHLLCGLLFGATRPRRDGACQSQLLHAPTRPSLPKRKSLRLGRSVTGRGRL